MNFLFFTGNIKDRELKKSYGIYTLNGKVLSYFNPYWTFKNPILRNLCKLHCGAPTNSRVMMPFRGIWNRHIFKNRFEDKDDQLCIIFDARYYAFSKCSFKYIRKKYPNVKIVLKVNDCFYRFKEWFKNFPSVEELKETYDLIITYNPYDAKEYGFTMYRPRLMSLPEVEVDESIPESDVFFVGAEKNRIDELINIFERCKKLNLKCDFHITEVSEEKQKYKDEIHYNTWINYGEVLKRVVRSKCVLNFAQKNGMGVTMRDYEAFQLNRMLLTNNDYLKETEFYHEDQVIWLDELEAKADLIKKGLQVKRDYSNIYNDEQWFSWLERKVNEK